MRRLIVTGSRNLNDWPLMYGALRAQVIIAGGPHNLTIVHGDCGVERDANGVPIRIDERSADALAHKFCAEFPEVTEEYYPADWTRPCTAMCYHKPRVKDGRPYCPVAGHLRNQYMVDLGATVVVAFPRGEARGTNDCIRRARKAGIATILS